MFRRVLVNAVYALDLVVSLNNCKLSFCLACQLNDSAKTKEWRRLQFGVAPSNTTNNINNHSRNKCIATSNKCLKTSSNKCLKTSSNKCLTSSNKCLASSNKCLTSSNKKLVSTNTFTPCLQVLVAPRLLNRIRSRLEVLPCGDSGAAEVRSLGMEHQPLGDEQILSLSLTQSGRGRPEHPFEVPDLSRNSLFWSKNPVLESVFVDGRPSSVLQSVLEEIDVNPRKSPSSTGRTTEEICPLNMLFFLRR